MLDGVYYTIEEGKYGPRMALRGIWDESLLEIMRQKGVKELYLNYVWGWQGKDLSFLSKLKFLKAFGILDRNKIDISGIHYLTDLKSLHVDTYCQSEVDFNYFKSLEDCALEWRPKAKSIAGCSTLKSLFLSSFKVKDFKLLSGLTNLEKLRIKGGSPSLFDGLSELTRMTHLELHLFRYLSSLEGIEKLVNLTHLEISSSRNVKDYQILGELPQLKVLRLDNIGPIATIQFILDLKNLEIFDFVESTNIADGDVSPLLANGCIKNTGFQNRRHYSCKCEDIQVAIEKREGLPPGTITGWPNGQRMTFKAIVEEIMNRQGF